MTGFSWPEPPTPPTARPLVAVRGLELRYAALIVLDQRWGLPRTIAEMLDDMAAIGVRPDSPRPGKALADAMRCEVRKGRAERRGWGQYRVLSLPRTTRWRARNHLDAVRAAACDDFAPLDLS